MMPVIEMTRARLVYVVNTMTRFEYDREGIDSHDIDLMLPEYVDLINIRQNLHDFNTSEKC